VNLPVMPPVRPMLSKSGTLDQAFALLDADNGQLEPKWDGFRAIVFRDGEEVELASRNTKPLTRYFPELLAPLRRHLPERAVVDGEIVIAGAAGLDFDALQNRIHPAASRINMLAVETPASFVAFDLVAEGDADLRPRPFGERRARLERALAGAEAPVHLTPATADRDEAADWFTRFEGAGLDGVVAKRLDLPYREDERVMIKVKHERTADCVVAGFRWHKTGGVVGSLLLGLYDDRGVLHHVGVIGAFPMAQRKALVDELGGHRLPSLDRHPWARWMEAEAHAGQRQPGGHSRWNAAKDLSFEPLRPDLVVEVAYEHMQGDRFRHAARFRRWRPDRDPESCTYAQLETPVPEELARVFG
jgi:ATP-dependent DNA ligase